MSVRPDERALNAHYGRDDLTGRILGALRAAGMDTDALEAGDLAPLDQFHTRGRRATLDLARLAGVSSGMRVLDVGGGLGGPARTLAKEFGCSVEVLDVTEEFCRAGAALTARLGLDGLVSFRHGSALDIPHQDASFDLAWTQHSSMNIADKERLYAEVHRILRPGGRLAMHEIMAGPVSPVRFPVPWAREPSISHLQDPETVRARISAAGFTELAWIDETPSAAEWFAERAAASPSEDPPPLGLHLLLGDDFTEMLRNQARNLREDRIAVIRAVFARA